MRVHQENIGADDADVLAGTALDVLEAGGQLDIFWVSTQADTLGSITGPNAEPVALNVEIPNETRTIRVSDDPSLSIPVAVGGHFTVSIDIVTGATVQFLAIYRKAGLDF